MLPLRDLFRDPGAFRCGVELVSTRGTMQDARAVAIRDLASELVRVPDVDWVSITDNAGGNPMLGPLALGKPVLYAGKEVLIHLSCKDFNRNGLESQAWLLASEGFSNILALSGDYPAAGHGGGPKPVFDLDSVGLLHLLSEMNRRRRTAFFLGAVATPFKRRENELLPQLLKLEKKLEAGADFVVAQIGFDARKSHELKAWLDLRGRGGAPLIGNVFLLSARTARFFHEGRIPGVVVTDALLAECERRARSKGFFLDLAAKQVAVFKGLGYRGVYLGGVDSADEVVAVLDRARAFGRDWKAFARELRYPQPGEFYAFAEGADGLADPARPTPLGPAGGSPLAYRLSRWVHEKAFTPGTILFEWGARLYRSSRDPAQGPALLRFVEHVTKAALFSCRDCGHCALPDTAYLCPESQCAKNQRNGPCGGTRDGKCEVAEFECIWARAYDRLKAEGRAGELLAHAPVLQDQGLRGTSSWGNAFLEKDRPPSPAAPSAPVPREVTHA
jgi:methylenetetrahydrofolate reductase (NADPH)